MVKLSRKLRIALLPIAALLVMVAVLWYPYGAGRVPQWKLQVVDSNARPVIGAQVVEQWTDPIDDGITSVDSRTTDANGFVVFQRHPLRNRLALGTPRFKPAALITVCTADQYGDVVWEEKDGCTPAELQLKKGPCPYD